MFWLFFSGRPFDSNCTTNRRGRSPVRGTLTYSSADGQSEPSRSSTTRSKVEYNEGVAGRENQNILSLVLGMLLTWLLKRIWGDRAGASLGEL